MDFVLLINIGIAIISLIFAIFFVIDIIKHKEDLNAGGFKKSAQASVIAVVTLFFDTLGIGCYAPMTASFKGLKVVEDRLIPGTLNTACVAATACVSIIFISSIEVEIVTLVTLIAASAIGAFLGAGIVAKLPVNKMRIGMGCALITVALVMLVGLLGLMPVGGDAIGLSGIRLVISAVVCFILGALMTIGVGAYAPIMATVYIMGLSPAVSFPIMMGACGYLIPAAGIRFIKEGMYDRQVAVYTNTIGVIGVFVAAFIITSLPLNLLRWLVIAVVIYTGSVMLRDGFRKANEAAKQTAKQKEEQEEEVG